MTDAVVKPKPSELVAEYISLRDLKKQADERYAEWSKLHYDNRMVEIETTLLQTLDELGSQSIASEHGTAFKKLSTSVTVADAREFRRHIIGGENWDLADWRPNKTAVQEIVDGGGELPPGLNYSTRFVINVRRK